MLILLVWLADAQAPVWAYVISVLLTSLWTAAPRIIVGSDPNEAGEFLWALGGLILWPVILGLGAIAAIFLLALSIPIGLAEKLSSLMRPLDHAPSTN